MNKVSMVLLIVAALAIAACFGAPDAPPSNLQAVSAEEYGDRWPLTVERGLLKCVGAGEVVLVAPGGTQYALNGMAMTKTKIGGPYRKVDEIWADDPDSDPSFPTKKSIGQLITDGLKLCK